MPTPSLTSSQNPKTLALATALLGALLVAMAVWTQSRMGGQLLPHAFCLSASSPLLALHLVSGVTVALAYLLIPVAMLSFVRQRKDLPFGWVAWVFGAFIFACGVTHALDVWTLYYPVYWYAGVAKAFTAVISLATAWLIYRLTPLALSLPSARQLQDANAALQREVERRRIAESELIAAKAEVESLLREAGLEARRAAVVLDRFFEAAPLGIALMDAELRILRTNARLPELTGRPSTAYAGGVVTELPHFEPAVLAALLEVRDQRQPRIGIDMPKTDGTGWLKCDIFPIDLGDQHLIGAVVSDVSAERALQHERNAALAAATEADQRKTEFLAVLSHELRNPLAPVRAAAAFLKAKVAATDSPAARMITIIERQVAHMGRLIDDLLDISRIERGKFHHEPADIDLAEIVRQVCHDHERGLADAGVVLRAQIAPALPVFGDAVRLAQAVGNYLHNAAKFGPRGEVTVRAFADSATNQAVVSVTDQGAGIAPQLMPKLFEPFVQGEQSIERSKGGLGLGLSLVRRLVQMHGGQVAASSPGLGQGATFELRIPLRAGRS